TLSADSPPEGLSLAVQALWQVAKGDWDQAHKLAQDQDDGAGAWVHAHLHRVEGDLRNAGHWYRKANREVSEAPLPKEWDEIAAALL
ncbi:MAG: hypothetical protein VCE75_20035, partial [Alphaproteobacteria bacterium]